MWAIGIYDLRLQEDQFWRLTIYEFNMLLERHKQKLSAENYNSALICSVIANVHRQKGKTFQPSDFMPKEVIKKKIMPIDEMLEILKAITVKNGGEIKC